MQESLFAACRCILKKVALGFRVKERIGLKFKPIFDLALLLLVILAEMKGQMSGTGYYIKGVS